jgi:hypothetical protein
MRGPFVDHSGDYNPALLEAFEIAEGQDCCGFALKTVYHETQHIGVPHVVGVEKTNQVPRSGCSRPGITRGRGPPSLLREHRYLIAIASQDFGRGVGGPVVHNNDLHGPEVLLKSAINSARNRGGAVMDGDDDRYC